VRIAKRARFLSAAGRVVFRIEIEYNLLAAEIGKLDGVAIGIGHLEVRGFVTFFKHRRVYLSESVDLESFGDFGEARLSRRHNSSPQREL
jgi:hypothetical protein